ncbi:c-type cytochrome biogenesis protein CcmI [Roseivivax sp. THAF30]|uniref:c-type cytochrome biogenesis protein CcmI n=1 Tax=Roseivivax sp. THAF30 TaxID=2587852 RepID=UPI0020C81BA8|nr:c-type cytochrome biogenesis protein CcmI [Roseivivax sp. THAF30]
MDMSARDEWMGDGMIAFWILSAAMALLVGAVIVLALLRGRRSAQDAVASDIGVYRDQLREIDRDEERGTVGPEEAQRLRTEVSRRLLAADAKDASETAAGSEPKPVSRVAALLIALFLVSGSIYLYASLGAPGYGDLGLSDRIARAEEARQNRPAQSEAESDAASAPAEAPNPEYQALVERLRATVAERQNDVQGFQLLARSEAALGNYRAAYRAQERIIELKGEEATAEDYADLADMMVLAAGGYVSPEAEAAVERALNRDPENGVASYYAGLSMAQTGRPDRAFRIWDNLLRRSTAEDAWVAPIMSQIEDMAWRAGVNDYSPPVPQTALPGPTADELEAAGELSEEDRQGMIEGMVARLSDRLATQGGSPEEWARLISAYGVLGNLDQARAILQNAEEVFLGDEAALTTVREAARSAGVEE